jgi:broad specificity phosphatase PhoE
MIEIFAFRHGETDWNKAFKFQGQTNIPLNDNGREQAVSLISKLAAFSPEVLLCSDLDRAVETAKIASQQIKVETLYFKELRECHLGQAEALHKDVVASQFGEEAMRQWNSIDLSYLDFAFPGGESKRQNLQRIINCILGFSQKNSHFKRIAVSSHGGTLKRLVHHCENAPAEAVAVPNCVSFRIDLDVLSGRWFYRGTVD